MQGAFDACLPRGLFLVACIHHACRILAHQHHAQAGLAAMLGREGRRITRDLDAKLCCRHFAVEKVHAECSGVRVRVRWT